MLRGAASVGRAFLPGPQTRGLPGIALLLAACSAAGAQEQQVGPWAGGDAEQLTGPCLACHSAEGFASLREDGTEVSLSVDLARLRQSVHGDLACTSCHWDFGADPHAAPLAKPPQELARYVRELEGLRDHDRAALASCGGCHEQAFGEYWASVHGTAVLAGEPDAPTCSACHGTHYITSHADLESSTSTAHVPATCGSCHADAILMARYDLTTGVTRTYDESLHGKKAALGSQRAAVCTSCHGVHDIQSPSDPTSSLYPGNRVATCAKCHEDANPQFALSFGHIVWPRTETPWAYWTGRVYWIFIWTTIAALVGFIVLERTHPVLHALRRRLERRRP